MIGEYKNINWPTYDEKYLHDTNVTIVLQINGKKRALFNVKKNLGENELFEQIKNDNKLLKYIEGNNIKKRIYVKNKIMNLII